jgi:hypothetical protein
MSRYLSGISGTSPSGRASFRDRPRLAARQVTVHHRIPVIHAAASAWRSTGRRRPSGNWSRSGRRSIYAGSCLSARRRHYRPAHGAAARPRSPGSRSSGWPPPPCGPPERAMVAIFALMASTELEIVDGGRRRPGAADHAPPRHLPRRATCPAAPPAPSRHLPRRHHQHRGIRCECPIHAAGTTWLGHPRRISDPTQRPPDEIRSHHSHSDHSANTRPRRQALADPSRPAESP